MTDPFDPAGLERLADDTWETLLGLHPTFATSVGERRFDARVPPVTRDEMAHARAALLVLQGRLDALGTPAAEPDAVSASALREALAGEVAAIDAGLFAWDVDPLEGIPVGFLNVPSYQPLVTPADGDVMVERWRAMAGAVAAYDRTLRESLADGLVACAAPVRRNVEILDGLLAEPDERWPLLAPLAVATEPRLEWSTADREQFATGLREAVAGGIRPSLVALRETLATAILPNARPTEQPGIGELPGGATAYRSLIRVHTSLDLEPEEVHRIGLAEIERIDGELTELTGRVLGTKSLAEGIARLREDPALTFSTSDEVEAKAIESLARANAAIPDWFGRLPKARCEVVRMGSHEEEHSTIAYYLQPSMDGSRPGRYYINTSQPQTRPRYEAEVLAYHEAVPGHHLQIAIAQELEGLHPFRRNLGPTAFVEGWGLYTERLADEMGLYTGDLDRIGVLSYDAWRASRLVVDTGMHALGWSRDRAVAFMVEHTALARNNIENEVDRYIVWPGQALAYKIGQLELLRLRAETRERLGSAFDIRAFHDAVLENGALALPTLRGLVEAWADGVVSAS